MSAGGGRGRLRPDIGYTGVPVPTPPAMSQTASEPLPANAERHYQVRRAELPLSCPTPAMALWNSHPRVYLPIEASGEARCPYCGAVFTLVD